ncbi:MAG TPA: hypothetical protein VN081_00640 [Dongiaceae bacterium]|nr:hypothetical protein [Dongiaceae bacterium]
MLKQTVSRLLDTEMDRKEFLKIVGIGTLAVIGFSQVIKALGSYQKQPSPAISSHQTYGGMAYGGIKSTH